MKHILVLIFALAGTKVFSQEIDFAKVIQTGKWFPGLKINSKKIVYYRKPQGKTREETVEFKKNGKMIHCDEITESVINKESKKVTRTDYVCDSVQTYEIKNGMMQIRLLDQLPNFYKIQVKGETFELTPVKSEADGNQ